MWLQGIRFKECIVGSNYIFSSDVVVEIITFQPGEGGKAKPYQVKQVRAETNIIDSKMEKQ
jgi:hypothetical protein